MSKIIGKGNICIINVQHTVEWVRELIFNFVSTVDEINSIVIIDKSIAQLPQKLDKICYPAGHTFAAQNIKVQFAKESPTTMESIRFCSLDTARVVIILPRNPLDPQSDFESKMLLDAIRMYNRDALTVVVYVQKDHEYQFRQATQRVGVDEMFGALIARAATERGVMEVLNLFLSSTEGSNLFSLTVPKDSTYEKISIGFSKFRNSPIGKGTYARPFGYTAQGYARIPEDDHEPISADYTLVYRSSRKLKEDELHFLWEHVPDEEGQF